MANYADLPVHYPTKPLETFKVRYLTTPAFVLLIVSLLAMATTGNADVITPVAVPFSSGLPYAGDPTYAADKAIDGDLETFCVLQDDTLTGTDPSTHPAYADDPTTGRMVFDLGAVYPVYGMELFSVNYQGTFNPKDVEFFRSDANGDDLGLLKTWTFQPLEYGASERVAWAPVDARYIGMRVNTRSFEGLDTYYNFQIAEVRFNPVPEPATCVLLGTMATGLLAYAWRRGKRMPS